MRNLKQTWFGVLLAVAVIGFSGQVHAQSQVGTTAASFLEIPVGARGTAMGQAYVSTANEVSALYWNPAGITNLETNQATFHYTDWFVDTRLNYAAAVIKINNMYIGGQLYMFDGGQMDVTTVLYPDGTGEEYSVSDISLGLSYGQKLTNTFSIGGSVKFLRSSIWRMDASTLALDLGFQYQTPLENLDMGFSISNFGGEMKMEGDNTARRIDLDPNASGNNDALLAHLKLKSWDLPLIFRIGLNYEFLANMADHSFIVSSDAVYPNSNNNYINVGGEYGFQDLVFLRGGYSYLFLDDDYGTGHIRFGFGVKVADRIIADYSFSDRSTLGGVHMIGASVNF